MDNVLSYIYIHVYYMVSKFTKNTIHESVVIYISLSLFFLTVPIVLLPLVFFSAKKNYIPFVAGIMVYPFIVYHICSKYLFNEKTMIPVLRKSALFKRNNFFSILLALIFAGSPLLAFYLLFIFKK